MADVMQTGAGGIRLDDKWSARQARILLSGTQAIVRMLIAQARRDRAAGLNTAGYISGYRGSPLGNVDTALWAAGDHLAEAGVTFIPGVNEDLAATAVRGTQQLDFVPGPRVDGVFAAWYGKGPGVDRSLDALKHGNYGGAHRNGGVLIVYGDDHAGKSSTISHQSEAAIAAAAIPSLYPADVSEIVRFGLLGYAMSRHTGSWIGIKLVNEVAEQTATVSVAEIESQSPVLPPIATAPPEGLHPRAASFVPLREEQIVREHRLPLVHQFVRANGIDRIVYRADAPSLGIVAAGKSFSDTRQALAMLGLDDAEAASRYGVSLYKVGCVWPLEPEGLLEFTTGHRELLVVEEKEAFLEPQVAAALFNQSARPLLTGKRDETGAALLPLVRPLEPIDVARVIVTRLDRLGMLDDRLREAARAITLVEAGQSSVPALRRPPYFCSGCPHSRSTRVPEGSLSMTGIGCHTMVALVRPGEALPPTHMGGEGMNWAGLSLFTDTPHMFQNMGDGTYYHSGLLAIRAAVASGANITYKLLYNDAVAMTGGQPIDGPISVAEMARQVLGEGVRHVVILSDNPDAHRGNADIPESVRIGHRDELDEAQRMLREMPGATVLIYEQTCAAEKRRRRKRGLMPQPTKRLFIVPSICEGCGDCSVQSTCVSLTPLPTDLGMKRQIDQNSCNMDYSCQNGFCPSFVTVEGGTLARPAAKLDPDSFADLPTPPVRELDVSGFAAIVAGIGGTGVITVGAILGMAAHIEGRAASTFDMTGLAQKNGAVFSHVRIAPKPTDLRAQRVGRGEADLVLAFDTVAALSDEARQSFSPARTVAIANVDVVPTLAFQFDARALLDGKALAGRLTAELGGDAVIPVAATHVASALLGNPIGMNLMLIGIAVQRGLLPVGPAAIERAVELNGASVQLNLAAFRLGRALVAFPDRVAALLPAAPALPDQGIEALVARRMAHLRVYQGDGLADRYRQMIDRVQDVERALAPDGEKLTRAVATTYATLLAYKDEYEVARLIADPALERELKAAFGDKARMRHAIAPPVLAGPEANGRPGKRAIPRAILKPAMSVLAHGRILRGTRFDPFGYTKERRNERALISHYEVLADEVLGVVTTGTLDAAAAVLALAGTVRGYGPVKEQKRLAYLAKVDVDLIALRGLSGAAVAG